MKAAALSILVLWTTPVLGGLPFCQSSDRCSDTEQSCAAVEGCFSNEPSPWTGSLTQTVDYGTSLTLPIGLLPANTMLATPGGGPGGIITDSRLGSLGLLDNILGGAPIADSPTEGYFRDDWMFSSASNLQYQKAVGDDGQFTAGYGYYQNLHASVKQLDLFSHTLSTQYAHQLSDHWTGALNYSFAFYELDHRSLVSQNNAGAGVAYRPTDLWAYEFNFNFTDSNFRGIDSLDAQFYSGRTSITRYTSAAQTSYLSGGYQYGYWDARADTFSYDLHSVFVNVRKSLNRDATLNLDLGGSYGNYGFRDVDFIQQDRQRDDDLFGVSTMLSKQIGDRWTLFARYIYADSNSNVVRQQYASSLVSTGVTLTF